jgi:hypothetical protein
MHAKTHTQTQVVIAGAGPYGLSLAAHLNDRGVDCRIFGRPMQMWSERMPLGMVLKSDGFASNLTAGSASYTLADFCREKGHPYHPTNLPVKLEYFVEYGSEFQRRFVPQLVPINVAGIRRVAGGFEVVLEDGDTVAAPRVVVAAGISHFARTPSVLAPLPPAFATHASSHRDLSTFAGREVTVLGAGASALEMAAILNDHGAKVTVVARAKVARFHDGPKPGGRTLLEKLRAPSTELGPGWRSWWACKGPHLFRLLPEDLRLKIVHKHLGPAGGWSIKPRVVGKTQMLLGVTVREAAVVGGKVRLTLQGEHGTMTHETGHVIAATGYEVDLARLAFLDDRLRSEIACSHGSPALDANFQSSVPGLYFVGLASALNFGPVMRFACGAGYAAPWLARHLARSLRHRPALEAQSGAQLQAAQR